MKMLYMVIVQMFKMMRYRSGHDWYCVWSPGSAADAYDLLEGDEIMAINGVVMTDYYQGSVMYVINQGVRTGVMELVIRRYPCAGNFQNNCHERRLWYKNTGFHV